MGMAYGFGLFVDNTFAGEINLNNVVRGALQCGDVGYWIDQRHAGNRYIAEGGRRARPLRLRRAPPAPPGDLHRAAQHQQPPGDGGAGIREEGIAQRYLEINGTWEDHMRYAITAEEWAVRRDELTSAWL